MFCCTVVVLKIKWRLLVAILSEFNGSTVVEFIRGHYFLAVFVRFLIESGVFLQIASRTLASIDIVLIDHLLTIAEQTRILF